MSLDPARATLVRRMVPDPTAWPGAVLCMKRIENGRIDQFGFLEPDDGEEIVIFDHGDHSVVGVYPNLSECRCPDRRRLGGGLMSDLLKQIERSNTAAVKDFWIIVAVDYDLNQAWILDQSQDCRDVDLINDAEIGDAGIDGAWMRGREPGLYKLTVHPWSSRSYEGEWDCGIDIDKIELLVAFPPRVPGAS